MMVRAITLAALQPTLIASDAVEDPKAARQAMLRQGAELLKEAGGRGADVACLPECFPTMALPTAAAARLAESDDLPAVMELGRIAQRYAMTLVMGIYRRAADGSLYNSTVIVEDGRLRGIYDKVHPTQPELDPPLCVVAGTSFPVFSLSWGTAGVLICHDNSFVESARCLTLAGAEVLFWPHVQSGWGDAAWEAVLRARAIDNGVWVVSSCFSVAEGKAWRPGMMLGRSSIVAPDGTILADAGHHPGMALSTVDLAQPRLTHDFCRPGDHPYQEIMLQYRRPAAYGRITAPIPAVEEILGRQSHEPGFPMQACRSTHAGRGMPERSWGGDQ
jgi:predicted amidohydrolase